MVLDCMYMNSSLIGFRTFISTLVFQPKRLVSSSAVGVQYRRDWASAVVDVLHWRPLQERLQMGVLFIAVCDWSEGSDR